MAIDYNAFLADMADRLKKYDFQRSRYRFKKSLGYGDALIIFQKSQMSTAATIRLTANVRIVHAKISKKFKELEMISECQYDERLGFFRKGQDFWWEMSNAADAAAVAQDIENDVRDGVMPELAKFSAEDSLAKMWEAGRWGGLGEWDRIKNLSVYYAIHFEKEKLAKLRAEVMTGVKGPQYLLSIMDELQSELEKSHVESG